MAGSTRAAACGLAAGLLCWAICAACSAQEVAARPEVVPAPPPTTVPQQDHPQVTYGPLQAAQDAYRMAEQERRHAVDRQVHLLQSAAWWRPPWPAPYLPAVPPVPPVPPVYGYGFPYGPRLGFGRAYRYGYYRAVPLPWPPAPPVPYVYPYSPQARQPTGYEKVWTGPNSYVYRPYYGQPTGQPNVPAPSSPSTRPPAPAEQPSGPALHGPIQPAPEPIPTPAAEPPPGES
jgi:hypothetical protein